MTLGYISQNLPPPRVTKHNAIEICEAQDTAPTAVPRPATRSNWLYGLLILNVLLFAGHLAAAVSIGVANIAFPLTVFDTRLTESVVQDFTCAYTNGYDGVDPQCSNPSSYSPDCDGSITENPFIDAENSPLLVSYQLTRVSIGTDAAEEGRVAVRAILFTIASITCLFHAIYALTWTRLIWWDDGELKARILTAGGLPSRWYEYAFTASLMSFFVSNGANVFDLNALVAIALGTFALMYFGGMIELLLYQGRHYGALVLMYIPGTALFAAAWLPSLRQVFGDIARLSCVEGLNLFTCIKTCFGDEVPIFAFVLALMLLFLVFPLITLAKIYYVGGWEAQWTGPTFRLLDRLFCVSEFPCTWILYAPVRALLHGLFFLAFAAWGAILAVGTVLKDTLWPLGNAFIQERVDVPDDALKWRAFLRGELMYAIASATSKFFLFIFFLTSFASRNW